MTQTLRLNAGRIIRAEDFEQQKKTESEVKDATNKAEDIIAAAEARAAEIIASAEANVQSIADDQLERFIDVQAVEKAANGVRDMVMATETIQRDFDAFTPWMVEFVEAAVRRITGATPKDAHWAGLIEQGLLDIRERWNLVLHCHPSMVADLKNVVSTTPSLSKAIKDVYPDRSIGLEDCLVQSAHGMTDISFSTQMAALVLAVEKLGDSDTLGEIEDHARAEPPSAPEPESYADAPAQPKELSRTEKLKQAEKLLKEGNLRPSSAAALFPENDPFEASFYDSEVSGSEFPEDAG